VPDASRPNPDALLAAVRREEARASRGHLKIFFGMAPGVGKTYAMLEAARREKAEGRAVVVGIVETHGRVDTQALLEGLEVVPRRKVDYRGVSLEEMDLEGILARKPDLVLIDELAHTNAPGSRHPKRYHDVQEVLAAGIDVYSTLNVQHLESRSDIVQQITGVTIREMVPDSVLESVDDIELVDITPGDLLERLKDGKVYLGDRATAAAANYFKESNLSALRELSLRVTAERVDRQVQEAVLHRHIRPMLRTNERLLVAIGPGPFSTRLIRWTRRMAYALDAPWLAVCVESSRPLPDEARRSLEANIALARELGAEVVLTRDDDRATALVRVAQEQHATQIIVGKPRGSKLYRFLRGGGLVGRLIRHSGHIDVYVHVYPSDEPAWRSPLADWSALLELDRPGEYLQAILAVVGVTGLAMLIEPLVGYWAIALVYLFTVIVVSLRVGRWPVMLAALLSALTWDYLFIPPIYTFRIKRFEDALMLVMYFAIATVTGHLTARIRRQQLAERERERRASSLYRLVRSITAVRTMDEALANAAVEVREIFGADLAFLYVTPKHPDRLNPHLVSTFLPDDKEMAVASWAFKNLRNAGCTTDTLPSAAGFYIPLRASERPLGVLGIKPSHPSSLTIAARDILESFATQIAFLLEREQLRDADEAARLLAESDRLHRTLLDSVSHELKTPLAVITSAAAELDAGKGGAEDPHRVSLRAEIRTACRRLGRLVDNLLDMTRLESGGLKPRLDWCDWSDLVNATVEEVGETAKEHTLVYNLPQGLPLVRADSALMEEVLTNVLVNAIVHTPAGTTITISAGVRDEPRREVFLRVKDRGPGFDPADLPRIFDKFYQGGGRKTGGLGLGLSIVRGLVEAQGGRVEAANATEGGAEVTIWFPFEVLSTVPREEP